MPEQFPPNQPPPYQQPYYPQQPPPKEPGIGTGFKLMLGGCLAIVVLAGGACVACSMLYGGMTGYYSRNSNGSSIYTPPPKTAPIRNLNLWKYNSISTGMKQEEVEKILGSKGKQSYDSTDRTGSMRIYAWQEGEAATACMISITFINEKVHDKSQFGLE